MQISNLEYFTESVRDEIKKAIDKINAEHIDICSVEYPCSIRLRIPAIDKKNNDLYFSVPFFNEKVI